MEITACHGLVHLIHDPLHAGKVFRGGAFHRHPHRSQLRDQTVFCNMGNITVRKKEFTHLADILIRAERPHIASVPGLGLHQAQGHKTLDCYLHRGFAYTQFRAQGAFRRQFIPGPESAVYYLLLKGLEYPVRYIIFFYFLK